MNTGYVAGSAVLKLVLIACCLGQSGCGDAPVIDDFESLTIAEYQARYSNFVNPWVGHQVDELIAERGPPDSVLEAKPRWTPSFKHGVHIDSYVYYNAIAESRACIDTFVVVEDSRTIIKYYCR